MTLARHYRVPNLSGERFTVTYHLTGDAEEARARAKDITLEQTVEFPEDLVPDGDIREHILGRVETLEPIGDHHWETRISYALETVGVELTQLLNIIFGNISIKPGIRLMRMDLSDGILAAFNGPRYGIEGWRALLGVQDRPLLCTALKPMGLDCDQLARIAYDCAKGGLDVIKDDHGLADQSFSAFKERVEKCAAAVAQANRETGFRCQYMPNVTAPADQVLPRAQYAKAVGAGALLICPGLTGFDAMRMLADEDALSLPVMSHPSFYGSMVTSPTNGMSHYALYGQLQRLAGADSSVYPNFGGRFAFSRQECESIVAGCLEPMGHLKPIFPAPGGGMNAHNIPEMRTVYDREVIYLMGGGLHRHGDDLTANARYFIDLIARTD